MRTRLFVSAAASMLVASLLAPTALQAKCAMPRLKPVVLTTRDTKLPVDGGILVGWQSDYNDGMDRDKDPSEQPTWTATAGKAAVALTRVSLAPGLSVYRPGTAKGPLVLTDGKTKLGTFTVDAKAGENKLLAPDIASVTLLDSQQRRWREQHTNVAFKVAPPAEAVAIVMYGSVPANKVPVRTADSAAGAGAQKPISYTPFAFVRLPDTHDKLTVVDLVADTGHCSVVPIRTRQPVADAQVAFAWVDAFGRVSPMSAPVAAKPAAPTTVKGPVRKL